MYALGTKSICPQYLKTSIYIPLMVSIPIKTVVADFDFLRNSYFCDSRIVHVDHTALSFLSRYQSISTFFGVFGTPSFPD